MSARKTRRYRIRRAKQGHMIVHKRWLGIIGAPTPQRWLDWHARRPA